MTNVAACSSGDVSSHRNQVARGNHGIVGPVAALAVNNRYALATGEILGTRAQSVDDADALESGRRRELRLNPRVQAAHIQKVGRVHRCGQHANPRFALPRFWNGALLDCENLGGLTVLPEADRFHDFLKPFLMDESRFSLQSGAL